jgi:hypothetical protein
MDLAVAKPHERPGAHWTAGEWQVYSEGYYTAIVMALRVMDLAVDRWRLARQAHPDAATRERIELWRPRYRVNIPRSRLRTSSPR